MTQLLKVVPIIRIIHSQRSGYEVPEIPGNPAIPAAEAIPATKAVPAETDGVGGRLSSVSLSGGFGTITLGQIWSASAIHYGFAVDTSSYTTGLFGGASGRNANTVSYSSSAGDVTFQIDKVTGDSSKGRIRHKCEFRSGRSFARLLE